MVTAYVASLATKPMGARVAWEDITKAAPEPVQTFTEEAVLAHRRDVAEFLQQSAQNVTAVLGTVKLLSTGLHPGTMEPLLDAAAQHKAAQTPATGGTATSKAGIVATTPPTKAASAPLQLTKKSPSVKKTAARRASTNITKKWSMRTRSAARGRRPETR